MRKDTKLYKLLRFMYLNRDKKLSGKEIREGTGMGQDFKVYHYMDKLTNRINKIRINRKVYYQMKINQVSYIKRKLEEARDED